MKAHLKVHNVEEISQLYNPTERHTSKEANICLTCKQVECTGDCERVKQEKRSIKKVRKCKKSK